MLFSNDKGSHVLAENGRKFLIYALSTLIHPMPLIPSNKFS